MRLIDADRLGEAMFPVVIGRYARGWNDAIRAIRENAPTAPAVGVKHAQWYWDDDGYCRCSECNQKAPKMAQYQDEPVTTMTRFCPHCGSRMSYKGSEIL